MNYKSTQGVSGFTLVELLVTMLLSIVVLAGIGLTYFSQQRSYMVQSQVVPAQQNLRAGLHMISWDARMAGFGFTSGRISFYDGSGTDFAFALEIFNTNPDRVDIIYADANITTSITNPMPSSSAELNVASTDGFGVGDLVIITDGDNASLLEITTVQDVALKLQHNAGGTINPPGGHNIFPAPDGYNTGAKIYKIRYLSYDVDNSDPAHPEMRVDFDGPLGSQVYMPIAENVEDLQAVYIFADGGEAATYDNADGDSTNDSNDIRSIRITVAARTDRGLPGPGSNRPAIEDHAAGGTDQYKRRMLTSLTKVRNLGLKIYG